MRRTLLNRSSKESEPPVLGVVGSQAEPLQGCHPALGRGMGAIPCALEAGAGVCRFSPGSLSGWKASLVSEGRRFERNARWERPRSARGVRVG
jgi:hypothetical protein